MNWIGWKCEVLCTQAGVNSTLVHKIKFLSLKCAWKLIVEINYLILEYVEMHNNRPTNQPTSQPTNSTFSEIAMHSSCAGKTLCWIIIVEGSMRTVSWQELINCNIQNAIWAWIEWCMDTYYIKNGKREIYKPNKRTFHQEYWDFEWMKQAGIFFGW